MRKRAEQTWLVADSSKFDALARSFLRLSEVTGIITDDGVPKAALEELERTRGRPRRLGRNEWPK